MAVKSQPVDEMVVDGPADGEDDPLVYGQLYLACLEPSFLSADGLPCFLVVNGEQMPYSQVTDEHHELMTPEEYTAYFEVYQAKNG